MEKLSIGKMAKLNQVTVQTLRHYDKMGLLKPVIVDEISNYRYYTIDQCARLDMIQYMKCLGMSLEAIKNQLDAKNIKDLDDILSNQEKWIEEELKGLRDMKKAVKGYRDNISRYRSAPKLGEIYIEELEERNVYVHDTGINFYENDISTWEYMIRSLKEQVKLDHLPMVKFCNVGSILRHDKLVNKDFYSSEIFIFVDSMESNETIRSGKYLTLYFENFYDEVMYAEKLLNYAKKHNYVLIGDYICEVVVELPVFENRQKMFIKIQVPIK
ncbi:MerR family transcriptional regulator [Acidaminobacter sp. JC074]|uniref:MerR family transcriptional regulator n=1 Tax=Acidaminobacter sp. JC074 TaxID=2530199 RepID=UPI001F1042A5|nr:MerR family transcriptional regulator [Acidaminobacter sp. JC074]MCH4886497.1 MerR family transcriptional regulator [Acidaminobacter sp. JC074]